uniref:NTR domain-containing protein n=1 Tax=Ornithorhynchus anatinus TaxID=9258 RepID=A0A6I8N8R1_ORNAN
MTAKALWLFCLIFGSSSESPEGERKGPVSLGGKAWGLSGPSRAKAPPAAGGAEGNRLAPRSPGPADEGPGSWPWADRRRKGPGPAAEQEREQEQEREREREREQKRSGGGAAAGGAAPSRGRSRPSGPAAAARLQGAPSGVSWARPRSRGPPPHLNRPGRARPHRPADQPKPSWLTNRQPASLLHHFNLLPTDPDNTEKTCEIECWRDRDEREHYCMSEFAVNGIVHDVEMLGKGIQLVTLLVNNDGLYKLSRLYITPDDFFFRVNILAVDSSSCTKPCPDFKLGSRYIVMGQIYHKRRQLPTALLQVLRGRLRPGDGLLKSSGGYVKRFNRKRDGKVQSAVHTKCR